MYSLAQIIDQVMNFDFILSGRTLCVPIQLQGRDSCLVNFATWFRESWPTSPLLAQMSQLQELLTKCLGEQKSRPNNVRGIKRCLLNLQKSFPHIRKQLSEYKMRIINQKELQKLKPKEASHESGDFSNMKPVTPFQKTLREIYNHKGKILAGIGAVALAGAFALGKKNGIAAQNSSSVSGSDSIGMLTRLWNAIKQSKPAQAVLGFVGGIAGLAAINACIPTSAPNVKKVSKTDVTGEDSFPADEKTPSKWYSGFMMLLSAAAIAILSFLTYLCIAKTSLGGPAILPIPARPVNLA